MSTEKRYIAHLDQRAKALSSSARPAACPLCKSGTRLGNSESFSTHLSQYHGDSIERLSNEPGWNFEAWKESLEARARRSDSSLRTRETENPQSFAQQPAHQVSKTSPAEEFSHLSLNKGESPLPADQSNRLQPDADSAGANRKRPNSLGDGSQPQQSTKTARRSGDQSSSHFKGHHFDESGRVISRELFNPVSEASTSQATFTSRAFSSTPGPQLTSSNQHGGSVSDRGAQPRSHDTMSQSSRRSVGIAMPIDPRFPDMLMQPDSRPISQEQLAAEVKSIYAGLTMVESKCIHVDKAQAAAMRNAEKGKSKLADDHWQALIALHRTLLHEHHDFFLASQHPSASPALRRLASKYSMPSRMWKHGIHSFLELLRFRLPDSLEFMISFIYTAYQMMSLLYETVPAFEDTWIECLGDLGRYRMAIEDEDIRDRETWAGVARFWYSKAADRSPEVGRLYHHLAILARPNALQQLYLYSRSLISTQPFHSARDSILTLFNPIMARSDTSSSHIASIDTSFIKTHAVLFGKEHLEQYKPLRDSFLGSLDAHIGRVTAKWREQGAYVMIANLGALYDYGTDSPLRRLFDVGFSKLVENARSSSHPPKTQALNAPAPSSEPKAETFTPSPVPDLASQTSYRHALDLTISTASLVFNRIGDNNVLPFAHIYLGFLLSVGNLHSFDFQVQGSYVASSILSITPWEVICSYMNTLVRSMQPAPHFESKLFIRPEQGDARPLPEDHLIRGQVWSQDYFPGDWFKESEVDDEERSIEHASTVRVRAERVLWIFFRLASFEKWIHYDAVARAWSAIPQRSETISPPLIRPSEHLPVPTLTEPKDDVMTDIDSGDTSDEDSTEMKTLKKEFPAPLTAPFNVRNLHVPSGNPAGAAGTIIQKSYTVMVCDETLLLKDHDVFQLLVETEWKVVVPHQVFADLSILSKTMAPESVAAQQALKSVMSAYTRHSNIRILTASGEDITQHHLAPEKPNTPNCSSPAEPTASSYEKQDDLIGVTRRATDLNSYEKPIDATEETRSAVLLTEDRLTRVRAKTGKVASLAPSMLRRMLSTARSRMRSPSQTSRMSDQVGEGSPDPDAMET